MSLRAAAENRPPKPPIPPMTSGRLVSATICLIASTARPPSAVSTPASSYVTCFAFSAMSGFLSGRSPRPWILYGKRPARARVCSAKGLFSSQYSHFNRHERAALAGLKSQQPEGDPRPFARQRPAQGPMHPNGTKSRGAHKTPRLGKSLFNRLLSTQRKTSTLGF